MKSTNPTRAESREHRGDTIASANREVIASANREAIEEINNKEAPKSVIKRKKSLDLPLYYVIGGVGILYLLYLEFYSKSEVKEKLIEIPRENLSSEPCEATSLCKKIPAPENLFDF